MRKPEETGELVKLAGMLAILAVMSTTVAAFFNLAQ